MPVVETCFTPAILPAYTRLEANVAVLDVLRATSSICTAFMHGARMVVPVADIEALKPYTGTDWLIAAECDGVPLDFADFGNSPDEFTAERVRGRRIAYCTTNGTRTMQLAARYHRVYIGSYLNFSALCRTLQAEGRDVLLLCSGWHTRFNLEDSLLAGAIADQLLQHGFETSCDAVRASVDLWSVARQDLTAYTFKFAHRYRLQRLGVRDVVAYCHTFDLTDIVPYYDRGKLVATPSSADGMPGTPPKKC